MHGMKLTSNRNPNKYWAQDKLLQTCYKLASIIDLLHFFFGELKKYCQYISASTKFSDLVFVLSSFWGHYMAVKSSLSTRHFL